VDVFCRDRLFVVRRFRLHLRAIVFHGKGRLVLAAFEWAAHHQSVANEFLVWTVEYLFPDVADEECFGGLFGHTLVRAGRCPSVADKPRLFHPGASSFR